MRINNLKIKRFRGIKNTEIELDSGLNVLVGPNNCGKSSILEAIYMAFQFLELNKGISSWNDMKKRLKGVTLRDPLIPIPDLSYLAYNLKKSAHKSGRIELDVKTDIESFKTWALFSGHNMNVYTGKDIDNPGDSDFQEKIEEITKKPPTFVPLFSGVIALEEHKTAKVIDYYSKTGKASEILRNKFYQLQESSPEKIEKVKKYIKDKFDLDFIDSKIDELGIHVRTHYVENSEHPKKDEDFDISALGSGFQQILHLLLYIFSEETDVILIDEPDAHLHRNMQKILFDLLLEISIKERKQIVIATHSFEFIQLTTNEKDVKLFLIDKKQEKQTPISDYCEFLRDLYANGLISENDLKYHSTKFLVCEDKTNGKKIIETLILKYKPDWIIKGFPFIFLNGRGSANEHLLSSLKIRVEDENKTNAFIINDTDGLSKDSCSSIEADKSTANIKGKYLPYFEVENILLEPSIIKRAIDKKQGFEEPNFFEVDEKWIKEELLKIMESENIKSHLRKSIGNKIQNYYRILGESFGGYQDFAEKRSLVINDMGFEEKIKYMPGKEILGGLFKKLQEEKVVNINFKNIVESFTFNEVPVFLKNIIDELVHSE